MQHATIRPPSDDRLVARYRAVFAEGMQQLRLDLVLVHARPRCAHRPDMGFGGNLRGFAHQPQFGA